MKTIKITRYSDEMKSCGQFVEYAQSAVLLTEERIRIEGGIDFATEETIKNHKDAAAILESFKEDAAEVQRVHEAAILAGEYIERIVRDGDQAGFTPISLN